jgi:hypothetical protein
MKLRKKHVLSDSEGTKEKRQKKKDKRKKIKDKTG